MASANSTGFATKGLIAGAVVVSAALLWWVSQMREATPAVANTATLGERGGKPQGHVYAGIIEEPVTYNPFAAMSPAAVNAVLRYTTEGLLDWDPKTGRLRPALAASWSVAADGRTLRFVLREGARFANGTPVTRDAVMFTWQVLQLDPLADTSLGIALGRVEAVRAPPAEPNVIEMVLQAPGTANVAAVVTRYWVVDPSSVYAAIGCGLDDPDFIEKLQQHSGTFVGSGPYALLEGGWRRGKDVLLARNEHSWQREVRPGTWNLGGIRWVFAQNVGLPQLALRSGEVDYWSPPDPLAVLAGDAELAAKCRLLDYVHPLLQPYRIVWNTRRPPLDDPRVRRALALLAPRQQLVDSLLDGGGAVASGPFAPDHPATVPPLPHGDEARAEALKLLADAGYSGDADGSESVQIELLVPSEDPFFGQLAAQLAEAWRKAGVEVEVQPLEGTAFTVRVQERRFDGVMFMGYDSIPLRDLYPMLHSSHEAHTNLAGYDSAAVDALLDGLRGGGDAATTEARQRQVCEHLHRDQPILWLLHRRVRLLFNSSIHGATPGAMGLSPETFWVEPADQRN